MLKLGWVTTSNGIESLGVAISLCDKLGWNISVEEQTGRLYVLTGDQTLLITDSREAADAFIYGMGIALAPIPEDIVKRLRQEAGMVDE